MSDSHALDPRSCRILNPVVAATAAAVSLPPLSRYCCSRSSFLSYPVVAATAAAVPLPPLLLLLPPLPPLPRLPRHTEWNPRKLYDQSRRWITHISAQLHLPDHEWLVRELHAGTYCPSGVWNTAERVGWVCAYRKPLILDEARARSSHNAARTLHYNRAFLRRLL